jgi:acyl phosphate:glycerol-3-phosphate acyltransferase
MTSNILITFVPMLIGYLLASIPSGVWVGQLMFKKDVRTLGSGGTGMTNVFRNFGKTAGTIVFFMDLIKSVTPVLIASAFAYQWTSLGLEQPFLGQLSIMLTGFGTSLGHSYPIFAQFRGGKAVSSGGSFVLMGNWIIALIGITVQITIIKVFKIVSIGAMTGFLVAVLLTMVLWVPGLESIGMWNRVESGWLFTLTTFIIWLFIVYRHKENIQRLLAGKELDFKKKSGK